MRVVLGKIGIGRVRARRGDPAAPSGGKARVKRHAGRHLTPRCEHLEVGRLDRHILPEAIEGKPPGERFGDARVAVEADRLAVVVKEEGKQRLSLRGEKRRPQRPSGREACDVVGHLALEEVPHVPTRQPQDGAIGEVGKRHPAP